MATNPAPVLVYIGAKHCGACRVFGPDDEDKVAQGYQPGQLSEWEKLYKDPEIAAAFWCRKFTIGTYKKGQLDHKEDTIYTLPEQFNYIQMVPAVMVVTGGEYARGFDLTNHTVLDTKPLTSIQYPGPRMATEIKKWLLNNYTSFLK